MTDSPDRRGDTPRQQILRAASHQFAKRPYYDVGLDYILAEAALTKGGMYSHFRSKYALALAIIEEQTTKNLAAFQDLLTRRLSGLETLLDVSYLIAVQDVSQDVARAALHLVESVGRTEGLQARVLGDWVQALALIVARAIAEGDIIEQSDPQDVGRLFVSLYMGMRQTSDPDQPEQFLHHVANAWALVLRGIVPADRIEYFSQFIRRRTALAISTSSTRVDAE